MNRGKNCKFIGRKLISLISIFYNFSLGDDLFDGILRRHQAVVNDTVYKRESLLTVEKESVPVPGFCNVLPAEWFSSESRFTPCISFEEMKFAERPLQMTNPTLFGQQCANPLEWVAFSAIIIGVVSYPILSFSH